MGRLALDFRGYWGVVKIWDFILRVKGKFRKVLRKRVL